MKRLIVIPMLACLALLAVSGCSVRVNVNTQPVDVETLMKENALKSDPVEFNTDGKYRLVFHYDQGGFENADLSGSYVAFYPYDLVADVTSKYESGTDIPPLPADVQAIIDGDKELEKQPVITWKVLDDKTVQVAFADPDQPYDGRTYWYIIPSLNLAGSATPVKPEAE